MIFNKIFYILFAPAGAFFKTIKERIGALSPIAIEIRLFTDMIKVIFRK